MASSQRPAASRLSKRLTALQDLFGIDCRSLALFRIGLALVVLFDLTVRAADLAAFYTDAGVLPRTSLLSRTPNPWTLSIHLMSGTALVQAILLGLQGVCAIGLLLGYRTRWMAILSWFLLASLQRRNPLILGGADNYVRMMLFWGMFLPLGAQWSLEGALAASPQPRPLRVLSWATAAILLQTVLIYVITALYKWRGETWQDGSALYYALNLDLYAREPSAWLLQFPALLKWMTHAVLWFECLGPFVLFCPVFTGPIRTVAACGFLLMHLGFNALLYLELFPAVSATAMTLFLPSWFWDRVRRRPQPERPVTQQQSLALNAAAAAFLLMVFWVVMAMFMPSRVTMPRPLQRFSTLVYLDQAWKMFAPNPARVSGWLVVPGVLQDGTRVDVSRGGAPVSWDKPPRRALFTNERWRKYLIHFSLKKDRRVWRDYAGYLCRSWNAEHAGDKQLTSLELVLMARHTPPAGETAAYNQQSLLRHTCQ